MAILVRRNNGQWKKVEEVDYDDEKQLQKMLDEFPELVPVRDDNLPTAFIREAGLPGSGSTDMLGVDVDGDIYIVECKLGKNREIRRQVIGQTLEYAAFLWEKSYEEFDELFKKSRKGKSIQEMLGGRTPAEWSCEEFREKIEDNLNSGMFNLIIVVDKMNDELERIIKYVSSRGGELRLTAIELRSYPPQGDTEIIVPTVHGEEPSRAQGPGKLPIEEVIRRCNSDTSPKMQWLVKEWRDLGHSFRSTTVGFYFTAKVYDDRGPVAVFKGVPGGVLALFRKLRNLGLPEDLLDDYRQQVAKLPGFDKQEAMTKPFPEAPLGDLNEEDLRAFVRLNQELVGKWRRSLHEG